MTWEAPVVDARLEGWTRLARLHGWEDGTRLGAQNPRPTREPHDATCGCLECEGRLGQGPAGVQR